MKYFLLIFFGTSLFSALPPLEQSSREMRAILSDPQLRELVGSGEIIQEIQRKEGGYLLTTLRHTLWIEVHYLPREDGLVGPVKFELVFHSSPT